MQQQKGSKILTESVAPKRATKNGLMQQTENLNLNLIEGTDTVDWEVLNENFERT